MKFLILSDLHIHNYSKWDNNGSRLDNCLNVLIDAFIHCSTNNIKHILFVGDLFDQHKSVPTEVLNKTFDVFSELFKSFDVDFYAISGNHDLSNNNTYDIEAYSSLYILSHMKRFILLDRKMIDLDGLIIGGLPYFKDINEFNRVYSDNSFNNADILLIHQTPEHDNSMIRPDVYIKDFTNNMVFCGHIHKHEKLSDHFVIVGSPLHRDLGDEGQDKGFLVYDSTSNTFEIIYLDYPKFSRESLEVFENSSNDSDLDISESFESIVENFARINNKDDIYFEVGKSFL